MPTQFTPVEEDQDLIQGLQDLYRHGRICLPPGCGCVVIGWDATNPEKLPIPSICTALSHEQLRALLIAILRIYSEGNCEKVVEGEV